ncbi:MAG: FAD-dependent oxidoreductase [Desulfobacterales bacterium]|nr:FAD-dependent oxidoreductase [Desulfobacterales bacterium]
MNFVIIGGDAAGMSAASRAKRNNPNMTVTVLEKTQDVSYSACGMPYNIADPERPIEDLVVRTADVFRKKQGINLLTGHEVQKIDPESKIVSGTTRKGNKFSLPYDKLLMATGAAPIVPELAGIDLPGVMALKSLADGRRFKEYLAANKVKNVVILGMGYIGLEMAEALHARNIDVAMVKSRPQFLPWMEATLAQGIREELEKKGVALYPGCSVEKIEASDNRLKVVCPDLSLECDMVLLAVGITPNSSLAARAALELGPQNSVAVNRTLQTSDKYIFAAGDCADALHVVTGKKAWIPLALRANRAGWAAADNVCGETIELEGIAGTAVFKVFDLQAARTGLTVEEAKNFGFIPEDVTITARSRAHAHPGSSAIHVHMVGDKASGRLLGVQMVGREGVAHRINAPAVALHSQMTVAAFSQCDLAYAPPFGPTWDPMLTAANQLVKKL